MTATTAPTIATTDELETLLDWSRLASAQYGRLSRRDTREAFIAKAWEDARAAASAEGVLASGPAVRREAEATFDGLLATARQTDADARREYVAANIAAIRAAHDHSSSEVGETRDGTRYCTGCNLDL